MRQKPDVKNYWRLGVLTLASVYFLIFVGGVVRSTGSGMGCPDWPKCFGQWIPPTHQSQLPPDYKSVYVEQRMEKNQKFSSYLDFLGFYNLADEIRNDPNILVEEDFNTAKTWTEYINRLIGVLVGFLILATFIKSIPLYKSNPKVFWLSLATLVAVLFQGWIGSIVVSTNLLQWMITVHMLIALLIVALLTYLVVYIRWSDKTQSVVGYSNLTSLLIVLMGITILQIIMGTQVRESVDLASSTLGQSQRQNWVESLGVIFYVHRSFSILVLLAHVFLVYLTSKHYGNQRNLMLNSLVLLLVILLEIASGAIMSWFAIPKAAQPIHLVFACLAFGLQFYIYAKLRWLHNNRRVNLSKQNTDHVSYQVYH